MSKFSVLISIYCKDSPEFLESALKSIWDEQILKPAEIVIVKDGPISKELENIVESFKRNKPCIIVALTENMGLGLALKEGVKACTNEYIARMDSDDICHPERFSRQIRYLNEHKDVDILGTWITEFNNNVDEEIATRKVLLSHDSLVKRAKSRNPMNHVTVIFKRSAVLSSGNYEHFPSYEDYYLWIKLINQKYILANIPESLVYVRIGNDMIGRRHGFVYFKKEFNFYRKLYSLNFINLLRFLFTIISRLPLRLLPKSILIIIYKKILR